MQHPYTIQEPLNITQRQRIAKIPPDRTEYEAGFGLPPFEDRGSGAHFAILSPHQPATRKVATQPSSLITLRHRTASGVHLGRVLTHSFVSVQPATPSSFGALLPGAIEEEP